MEKILDLGQEVVFVKNFKGIPKGSTGKVVLIAEVELCVLVDNPEGASRPERSVRYLNLRQIVDYLRFMTADDTT